MYEKEDLDNAVRSGVGIGLFIGGFAGFLAACVVFYLIGINYN